MVRLRKSALFRGGAALLLLPLLAGCVAAAVPLVAATGMLARNKRTRAEIVAELPAANAAALADGTSVVLTGLTELPRPTTAVSAAARPWRDFAAFAIGRARGLAAGGDVRSALLTRDAATRFRSETRPCNAAEAAVVIDIDPGSAAFAPAPAVQAPPEVAAAIAELREAGVIVLWVSQASANEVAGVAAALQRSGLDPAGRDPILLVRREGERKQVLREEANQTVCVVAIAGDERADFDELFGYLRDPGDAALFDSLLGAGWFLVPVPLDQAPGSPERP